MPIKKVDDVKDDGLRIAGQEWQESLGVPDLTTRELDNAAQMSDDGKSDDEIAQEIRKDRELMKR